MAQRARETFVVADQKYLDAVYYTSANIEVLERIFGQNYVSNGGLEADKKFLMGLGLEPGLRVLEVACGAGTSSLLMARTYGVTVHGIDLSANMIRRAEERKMKEEASVREKVTFEAVDALEAAFSEASYDLIYSRDSVLHLVEKEKLYDLCMKWLKPGGRLFVTDYVRGSRKEYSEEFQEVAKRKAWNMLWLDDHHRMLEASGFKKVTVRDLTPNFKTILENDIKRLQDQREDFVKDFGEEEYTRQHHYWGKKAGWLDEGNLGWGLYTGTK